METLCSTQKSRGRFESFFENLNRILEDLDTIALRKLFWEDAWLRDMLVLSWDFQTLQGADAIAEYLDANIRKAKLRNFQARCRGTFTPSLSQPVPNAEWAESIVEFETDAGTGCGIVRLVSDSTGDYRIFLISLVLHSLRDGEEKRRDEVVRKEETLNQDPIVLVIGSGEAALMLGTCLQQLNLSTLILKETSPSQESEVKPSETLAIDESDQYYHSLSLLPPNLPTILPGDRPKEFPEICHNTLETNTKKYGTIANAGFNDEKKAWTIQILCRGGFIRTIHPRHIVLATRNSSVLPTSQFPGQNCFLGTILYTHQRQNLPPDSNMRDKKVIIVGSGDQGHAISQSYGANGADVTILKGKSACMESLEKGIFMGQGSLYGLPIFDEKIKVHPSQAEIKEFMPDGLLLTDGTEYQADIVVLPNGNSNMRDTAREILGEEVASCLLDVWDFDNEGEPNAICQYSGHPGFWYAGGNLAPWHSYLKLLALKIKASEEGLYIPPTK